MRYLRRGVSEVHWLTTAPTNIAAPTAAEISAGTNITTDIERLNNFEVLTADILRTSHTTPFFTTIRGASSAQGTPQLVFWDDTVTVAERNLFTPGATGVLVLSPYGPPDAAARVECWPVEAHGPAEGWDTITEGTRWSTDFAVTSRPVTNAVVQP